MMGDQPRLNFTSIENLDVKVGKSCPQSFYIFGKSFWGDTGIGIGIAKRAVFRESGDKSLARILPIALLGVEDEESRNLLSREQHRVGVPHRQ